MYHLSIKLPYPLLSTNFFMTKQILFILQNLKLSFFRPLFILSMFNYILLILMAVFVMVFTNSLLNASFVQHTAKTVQILRFARPA